jgi:hypothetical protein
MANNTTYSDLRELSNDEAGVWADVHVRDDIQRLNLGDWCQRKNAQSTIAMPNAAAS